MFLSHGLFKRHSKKHLLKSQRPTGTGPGIRKSWPLRWGKGPRRRLWNLRSETRSGYSGLTMELYFPVPSSSIHRSGKQSETVFFQMFSQKSSLWKTVYKSQHVADTQMTAASSCYCWCYYHHLQQRQSTHPHGWTGSIALVIQVFPHWNLAERKLAGSLNKEFWERILFNTEKTSIKKLCVVMSHSLPWTRKSSAFGYWKPDRNRPSATGLLSVVEIQYVCRNSQNTGRSKVLHRPALKADTDPVGLVALLKSNVTKSSEEVTFREAGKDTDTSKFLSILCRINSCPIKLNVIINKLNWEKYMSTSFTFSTFPLVQVVIKAIKSWRDTVDRRKIKATGLSDFSIIL